jgi:hypothetical protein
VSWSEPGICKHRFARGRSHPSHAIAERGLVQRASSHLAHRVFDLSGARGELVREFYTCTSRKGLERRLNHGARHVARYHAIEALFERERARLGFELEPDDRDGSEGDGRGAKTFRRPRRQLDLFEP